MNNRLYLYPRWVRIWHMINLLLFLLLIISGLSLQYSDTGITILSFSLAVSIHNICGLALLAGYVFFVMGNLLTHNGTSYHPNFKGMTGRLLKQARYYAFGIFKHEAPPFPVSAERKFNPLQKLSYVVVMYFFVPIVILTGIGLFFPDMLPENIFGMSGLHFIDLIHIINGFLLSLFLIVHVYFCTIGKSTTSNFKSMITGWHE